MPKPHAKKTTPETDQITLRLPSEDLKKAHDLAMRFSEDQGLAMTTYTDVLRWAIRRGLEALEKKGSLS